MSRDYTLNALVLMLVGFIAGIWGAWYTITDRAVAYIDSGLAACNQYSVTVSQLIGCSANIFDTAAKTQNWAYVAIIGGVFLVTFCLWYINRGTSSSNELYDVK